MVKYRKKPVEVDVFRWLGAEMLDGITDINLYMFLGGVSAYVDDDDEDILLIDTLEGEMKANKGDYLVKGIAGEVYPVKPEIFEKTYEEVE
ncbi:hypothetical protein ABID29_001805 [Streptococcus rupicaprae]|uniref:Phage protein n=1 Tax=Streptococcus rupicaprae TaxID=759619 RepID=A0ABV2FJD5_9STRE